MRLTAGIDVAVLILGCLTVTSLADVASQFERSFGGARLNSSLGSSVALGRALDHENQHIDAMDLTVSNVFGCASYADGLTTADTFRGDPDIQMTPFYVDEEADSMCFIIRSATVDIDTKLFPLMQFLESIPSALKIEESVFSVLDQYQASEHPLLSVQDDGPSRYDLTVSLFPNKQMTFNESTSFAALLGTQILDKLKSYKLDELVELYWSVGPADSDSVTVEELKRIAQWDTYAQTLSHEPSEDDPCGFGNMTVRAVDGDIVIPADRLLSIADPALASACFAFAVSGFAHDASVAHVALVSGPDLLNYRARSLQQSGNVGFSRQHCPYTAAGLTGAGQVVGVADTGLDEKSCFFNDLSGQVPRSLASAPQTDMQRRKVVQYARIPPADAFDLTGGHGTHVVGTVVGNNRQDVFGGGKLNGVAPEGKVAFLDLGTASGALYGPSIGETYPPMRKAGAYVCSNSWGGTFRGEGFYSGQQMDEYLYNNMDTVVLFANGNSGEQGNGVSTLTSQASAKNVIGVGASESTYNSQSADNIAYFSSQGPTYDGRIKPEIVAPGMAIESARAAVAGTGQSTCDVMSKSGTSMATPSAAGSALLIRQYFFDSRFWLQNCQSSDPQCHTFTPSGVLVKAVLIHSGKAMQRYHNSKNIQLGPPPDNMQGYGRVTLANVLPLKGVYGHDLFVRDLQKLVQNRQALFKFNVQDSSQPFKVTLSWYDPPGVANSARALIHNLDLVVYSPDRQKTYYGNGGSSPDKVNNNEQVYVENPQTGLWKVFVYAKALPYSGDQLFSIVVTYKGTTQSLDSNATDPMADDDYVPLPTPNSAEKTVLAEVNGRSADTFSNQAAATDVDNAGGNVIEESQDVSWTSSVMSIPKHIVLTWKRLLQIPMGWA